MMISRKRILSNSCNHLPMFGSQNYINTDEDVWFEKEKLYKVSAKRRGVFLARGPLRCTEKIPLARRLRLHSHISRRPQSRAR